MFPIRTRIHDEIITEFLPPLGEDCKTAIILCDGLPSVPSKRRVLEYWSKKGFWVFHPRYRGTWESGGVFLDHDPTEDILEVVQAVRTDTFQNAYDGAEITPHIQKVVVMGASFGGAVALLSSLDSKVDKVVAISPVVDWSAERTNTTESLSDLKMHIRNGFGEAYRFSDCEYDRLGVDTQFFNPISRLGEYDSKKLFILHAKDDMIVSLSAVERFIADTHCLHSIKKHGGHLSASYSTRFFIGQAIRRFMVS